MIDFLQQLDADVLVAINSAHCAFLDTFMWIATGRWIWVPFYAALLYMLVRRYGWRGALGLGLVIAAIIAMADQTCSTLIRPMAERLRPANLENELSAMLHIVNDYRGGAYGFPSCHGANTFALATFIILLTRSRALGWTIALWALLNCYTRLYLGVHYPGDILVGGSIGAAIAAIAYYAMRYFVDMPKMRPDSHIAVPVATAAATVAGIAIYALF